MSIICNLSECVNNNKNGECDEFLPNVIPKLKPNDLSCYLHETENYKKQYYENRKNKLKFETEEQEEKPKKVRKNGRKS